jgi:hypothetical protein
MAPAVFGNSSVVALAAFGESAITINVFYRSSSNKILISQAISNTKIFD